MAEEESIEPPHSEGDATRCLCFLWQLALKSGSGLRRVPVNLRHLERILIAAPFQA